MQLIMQFNVVLAYGMYRTAH